MTKRTDPLSSGGVERARVAKTASPPSTAKKPAAAKPKRADDFSTGRAKALRRKALALDQPGLVTRPGVRVATGGDTSPSPAALTSTSAVGATGAPATARRPVLSIDTTTYGSIVGNPPQYRITQQQADELRRLGVEHSVIGLPIPGNPDYAKQAAALKQEVTLLTANGIRTDTYSYLYWNQNGRPKTDAQIRADTLKTLDNLKGLPVKTFWLDVEFDPKLNPSPGAAQSQRMLDTASQAFQDWKKANPTEAVEFGIYTGKGAWDQMTQGPHDPYATKYAAAGVPLWAAQYPSGYSATDATHAAQDMASTFATGFGGWSTGAGNIRGWQYRAGEHDGHLPTFGYGLDRNVWLEDAAQPRLPITAIPSGSRADLPIQNQALYKLIQQDQGKPIDQRQFKTMQDVINVVARGSTSFKALGLKEADCLAYRWEDPWKFVQGVPPGVDQFSSTPRPSGPPPATTTPAAPTPAGTTPTTLPPSTPAGSYAACLGLARGATAASARPAIKALQDALLTQGYLPASLKTQTGYGTSFGPITEAGLKQFQLENGLAQTGVVDAGTVTALGSPRPRPAGFAVGQALQYREELGFPTGPAVTAPDGSLRQTFEHGAVWVGADHLRHVQVQSPTGLEDLVPPQKLGTAQSLAEADRSFLSQWGPTTYNDPAGANDHPWGFEDCGPTTSVMALSALGLLARPSAADASTAIDHQRDLILGYDSTASLGLSLTPVTTKGTVGYGLVQAGAAVNPLATDQTALDDALNRGNPVIIGSSNTWAAWGQQQHLDKAYLNNGNPGGHFVIVLGRAADGNYLVGDPLSSKGPIEVTSEQMKTCLKGAWGAENSLLEVSRP